MSVSYVFLRKLYNQMDEMNKFSPDMKRKTRVGCNLMPIAYRDHNANLLWFYSSTVYKYNRIKSLI